MILTIRTVRRLIADERVDGVGEEPIAVRTGDGPFL